MKNLKEGETSVFMRNSGYVTKMATIYIKKKKQKKKLFFCLVTVLVVSQVSDHCPWATCFIIETIFILLFEDVDSD